MWKSILKKSHKPKKKNKIRHEGTKFSVFEITGNVRFVQTWALHDLLKVFLGKRFFQSSAIGTQSYFWWCFVFFCQMKKKNYQVQLESTGNLCESGFRFNFHSDLHGHRPLPSDAARMREPMSPLFWGICQRKRSLTFSKVSIHWITWSILFCVWEIT